QHDRVAFPERAGAGLADRYRIVLSADHARRERPFRAELEADARGELLLGDARLRLASRRRERAVGTSRRLAEESDLERGLPPPERGERRSDVDDLGPGEAFADAVEGSGGYAVEPGDAEPQRLLRRERFGHDSRGGKRGAP